MSRGVRLIICSALLVILGGSPAAQSVSYVTRSDGEIARAADWIVAVLAHRSGERDRPMTTVAAWSRADVESVLVELSSIRGLMRDPRKKAFDYEFEVDRGLPSRPMLTLVQREVRYSGRQHDTLEGIASRIHGAGFNDSDIVAKAIVLHSDIARLQGLAGNTLRYADGQRMDLERAPVDHWRVAGSLSDLLRSRDGRDADLAFWYRATLTYMASIQMWNPNHALRAIERFENDPDLQFIVGCQRELLGAPRTQASIVATQVPDGMRLRVASADDELQAAASLFKRALERDGGRGEVRVHYGRVLTQTGRAAAAVAELRRAVADVTEPEQRYFAQLFLGAALEAANQPGEAKNAYDAAARLLPHAQSPRLALSHLAASRGDHEAASAAIMPLFDGPDRKGDDPWWSYFLSCGRTADVLLDQAGRRLATPKGR